MTISGVKIGRISSGFWAVMTINGKDYGGFGKTEIDAIRSATDSYEVRGINNDTD